MQNLNKQIEENKSLRADNDALKAENAKAKHRISQLDEKAVERVTIQLGYAQEELATVKSYNTVLVEKYNDLKAHWNAIWQEPEMTDAWRQVEVRKEREAKEKARQEAEVKRESMARQNRYIGVLDHMSCSTDTYVSLGGSNGCADQLTNWDGTQKVGLGAISKKKSQTLCI